MTDINKLRTMSPSRPFEAQFYRTHVAGGRLSEKL